MQTKNSNNKEEQGNTKKLAAENPFENHRSSEEDVQKGTDEIEQEQQFKEAQTERD